MNFRADLSHSCRIPTYPGPHTDVTRIGERSDLCVLIVLGEEKQDLCHSKADNHIYVT